MNQLTHEARCNGPVELPSTNNNPISSGSSNPIIINRNPITSINSNTSNSNNSNSNNSKKTTKFPIDDIRPQPSNTSSAPETVACPSCSQNIQKANYDNHQKYECKGQQIPCEFCQNPIPIQFYEQHLESCSKNPEHVNTSNPEVVLIPCESCGRTLNARVYEEHLENCLNTNQRRSSRNQQQNTMPDSSMLNEEPNDTLVQCDYCGQQVLYSGFDEHLASHQSNNNWGGQAQQQQQMGNIPNNFMFPFGGMMMGMPEMNMNMNGMPGMNMNGMNMSMPGMTMNGMSMGMPGMMGPSGNNSNQNRRSTRQTTVNGQTTIEETTQDENGNIHRTIRVINSGGDGSGTGMNQGPTMINFGGGSNGDPFNSILSMFGGGMMGGGMGGGGMGGGLGGMGGGGNAFLTQLLQQLGAQQETGLDRDFMDGLTTSKYEKEKSKNLAVDLKKCSICLTEFEDGEDIKFLPCTHRFHIQCIDPWLERHTTCPVCKKDFRNYDPGN